MFICLEFLMIFVFTIGSYLYPNFLDRWGDTNYLLPKKYLIHSKKILRYFLYPKHEITKHWVISHFVVLLFVIIFLITFFVLLFTGSVNIIFNNKTTFLITGVCFAFAILPCFVYDAIIQTKFILKK